ncbi:MAG: helix-turn-helix domain-containing protein [Paracoccaceae bacterium]
MTDAAFDWYGPDTATFGDRLAAARDATSMTQQQLAKRLGIKVATLKAWEGDLSEPRANRLSMLAGLLNVSITWLINGEGEGVDSPEETPEISQEMSDLLIEMRTLKSTLKESSDRLGRLEKQLRQKLKDAI